MSIHVEIPDPLAAQVAIFATSKGKTPEDVVLDAVARQVDPLAHLREVMAPVYRRMEELGITEDEAVEDFETEKHAMRRERRDGR
jgi:hypothetical protein